MWRYVLNSMTIIYSYPCAESKRNGGPKGVLLYPKRSSKCRCKGGLEVGGAFHGDGVVRAREARKAFGLSLSGNGVVFTSRTKLAHCRPQRRRPTPRRTLVASLLPCFCLVLACRTLCANGDSNSCCCSASSCWWWSGEIETWRADTH